MDLQAARSYILNELSARLDSNLYYHGIHHTLDVANAAAELAALEGITDQESLQLLETAALYHDCGFMNTYRGHEEESCRIAGEVLPGFGYSAEQIEIICGMIRATKVPQSPQKLLEMILCDADLDYLGRGDFEPVSITLLEELTARDFIRDASDWNGIQVDFFESHSYWTSAQQSRRDAKKASHLAILKSSIVND